MAIKKEKNTSYSLLETSTTPSTTSSTTSAPAPNYKILYIDDGYSGKTTLGN